MLTRAFLLTAALCATAARADDRLHTIGYQPQRIVTVIGRSDIETIIRFQDDEHVENVALGDSAAWQVAPNKRANLLFVKPQAPRGRTNMTVVTDRRTYLFDLVAGPKGGAPLYALSFTYPPAPPTAPASQPSPAAAVEATPAPSPSSSPADLHFGWTPRGSRRLLPARVFDDNHSLFLAWAADTPLPAMLTVAADGTEAPVNYGTRGGYVVVDGVPGRLVLRAGKESAMLDRDPVEAPAATPVLRTAER